MYRVLMYANWNTDGQATWESIPANYKRHNTRKFGCAYRGNVVTGERLTDVVSFARYVEEEWGPVFYGAYKVITGEGRFWVDKYGTINTTRKA